MAALGYSSWGASVGSLSLNAKGLVMLSRSSMTSVTRRGLSKSVVLREMHSPFACLHVELYVSTKIILFI